MKRIQMDSLVKIYRLDNSNPVADMKKLVGQTGKVRNIDSSGHYRVLGYWWSPLDIEVVKEDKSKILLFDVDELRI